jgi:hypothetical protein
MGLGRGDVLGYIWRSTSMETLISSMIASGRSVTRAAPHLVAHDFSLTTSYSGRLFRLLAIDRRNRETPCGFGVDRNLALHSRI